QAAGVGPVADGVRGDAGDAESRAASVPAGLAARLLSRGRRGRMPGVAGSGGIGAGLEARFGTARAEAFRILFDADSVGVALLDTAGRLLAANPTLTSLLAGTRAEAALRDDGPAVALFAPEHRAAVRACITAAAAGRSAA